MGQSHSSWGPGWPKGATVPTSGYTFHGQDGSTTFGLIATELHPMLDILLRETERRGYIVRQRLGCWGYANRAIAGTSIPSNHSRATAIDVNAAENGYGDANPAFPAGIAHAVWEACGWEWGGDWAMPGRDGMHLEYLPARSTVDNNTEKARRLFGGIEDEMIEDYTNGEAAYREAFKKAGKDPGEANPDKPAYFKKGWASARFAANNPAPVEGAPAAPHTHTISGKTSPA